MAEAHTKALLILISNLPVLTERYAQTLDAAGNVTYTKRESLQGSWCQKVVPNSLET